MENKPVCEIGAYGTKFWYLNRLQHREDGPARIFDDKSIVFTTEYWIGDRQFNEKDYYDEIKEMGLF